MRQLLSCLVLMSASWGGYAHDLWLVPPDRATAGKLVHVQAISGMDFPQGDRAPDPAKFAQRRVFDPDRKETAATAAGIEGKAGMLAFTPARQGVYAVAVETTPRVLTLDADAFNAYLVSDGLPHIYKLRAEEKTLGQPGKERYSKSPKMLLQVGDGVGGDPTKPLGLPLEIVPVDHPFKRKIGDTLKVRVLFRGQPLKDAHLGWDHPGDGDEPTGTVRTNTQGEALIPLAQAGLMTIRLTHMTRPKTADYEWESFWTTLTFRLPE